MGASLTSQEPVADTGGAPRHTLGQRACLDGIRGAALLGVIVFHLDYGWAAGGYFSVDIFFVLSGFLITSLLLHEFLRVGHINLAKFWSRRARRLIPALLLTLVAVMLAGKLTLPAEELGTLRRDGLAALAYVSNWVQAASGTNYFDLFTSRSLLDHFWTLAIEEQFYLIWPFFAAALFAWASRTRSNHRSTIRYGHPLIAVGAIGAIASAAWMAYLYSSRGSSISSALYFRTDTRAQAILIGIAFAGIIARLGRVDRAQHRELWDRAGIAAAVLIVAIMLWNPGDSIRYRGVFLVIAVLSGVLIASPMLSNDGLLNRALNNRFLRYCGRLSYGLYLWHWPVFQVLSPDRTGLNWVINDILRVAVTFGLAELSARLIEIPFRRGAFAGSGVRTALLSISAVTAVVFAGTAGATLTDAQRYARDQERSAAPPVVAPSTTNVMVFGDAFGASLGTNWASPGSELTSVRVTNAAETRCSVESPCPNSSAQWVTDATAAKPDIAVLALSSWIPFDNSGKRYDPADFGVHQRFVSQITAFTEQLRSLGIRIVAATPVEQADAGPASIRGTQDAFEESQRATGGWLTVKFPDPARCPAGSCVAAGAPATGPAGIPDGFLADLASEVRRVHVDSVTGSGSSDSRLRVLIVGDSVAWSLGSGWYDGQSQPPADADVLVWNRGKFFCGIDDHPGYELDGTLRKDGSSCSDWRTTWAADLATFDPDIVLFPASMWTTLDPLIDGDRVEWESPTNQARLKSLYTEAGLLLSEGGATVAFLSEAPNRNKNYSERLNRLQASRASAQSLMVAEIVTEHPDKFVYIDYAGFVCPNSDCTGTVDGVTLRPDTLHLSAKGSAIVAEWLEPKLIELGRAKAAAGSTTTSTPQGGSTTAPTSAAPTSTTAVGAPAG